MKIKLDTKEQRTKYSSEMIAWFAPIIISVQRWAPSSKQDTRGEEYSQLSLAREPAIYVA